MDEDSDEYEDEHEERFFTQLKFLPNPVKEAKTYYYNIEPTENPYVVIYTRVSMEELSDNFKIMPFDLSVYDTKCPLKSLTFGGKSTKVINMEALTPMLTAYKEMLLEKKSKVIIDTSLIEPSADGSYRTTRVLDYIRDDLQTLGLVVGNTGKVSLKRQRKPKKEKPAEMSMFARARTIKQQIEFYMSGGNAGLSINKISINITKANMYNTIIALKTLFPKLSYKDLEDRSFFRAQDSNLCKDLWDDPEIINPINFPEKETK